MSIPKDELQIQIYYWKSEVITYSLAPAESLPLLGVLILRPTVDNINPL